MFEKRRRRKLIKKFNELTKEISTLRVKLTDVNKNKEIWFQKKEGLKKQVATAIEELKEIKLKKDSLNKSIQNLKEQRDKYNTEVGKLINKAKELNKERGEAIKRYSTHFNPSKLKDRIEHLEQKIETEVMSFKKEQKLMNHIRKLKSEYNQSEKLKKIMGKAGQLSSEIDASKQKASGFHGEIQEQAKLNQESYKKFLETNQKLHQLKTEQEVAFRKFLRLKRAFMETNTKLNEDLMELGKVKNKLTKLKVELEKSETKKKEEVLLQEKLKIVEEKIKNGQKLTEDDLLIYQETTKP